MITQLELLRTLQQRLGSEGQAVTGFDERYYEVLLNLAQMDLYNDAISDRSNLEPHLKEEIRNAITTSTHRAVAADFVIGTQENGALRNLDLDDTDENFPSDKYAYLLYMPTDYWKYKSSNLTTSAMINAVKKYAPKSPTRKVSLEYYDSQFDNYFEQPHKYATWVIEVKAFTPALNRIPNPSVPGVVDIPLTNAENKVLYGMAGTAQDQSGILTADEGITVLNIIPGKDFSLEDMVVYYYTKPTKIVIDSRNLGLGVNSQLVEMALPTLLDYAATRFVATRNLGAEAYQVQTTEKQQ